MKALIFITIILSLLLVACFCALIIAQYQIGEYERKNKVINKLLTQMVRDMDSGIEVDIPGIRDDIEKINF